MSRATSAVDIEAESGRPWCEQPLPTAREEATAARSSALV